MRIAKALKKLARMKGEVKELHEKIEQSVSTIKGNSFAFDVDELLAQLNKTIGDIVELKTKIMVANIKGGTFRKILELGEFKGHMSFLAGLQPKVGITEIERYSGSSSMEYISQMTLKAKAELVQQTKDRIDVLIDELDDFNALTNIE